MTESMDSILIGGVITLATGIILMLTKMKLQKRREESETVEEWYSDIVSIGRKIRREALELKYGGEIKANNETEIPSISRLNSLVQELEEELDDAPPEVRGTAVDSKIRNLAYWYQEGEDKDDTRTTTDLKEGVIFKTEEILDEIEERSENVESAY